MLLKLESMGGGNTVGHSVFGRSSTEESPISQSYLEGEWGTRRGATARIYLDPRLNQKYRRPGAEGGGHLSRAMGLDGPIAALAMSDPRVRRSLLVSCVPPPRCLSAPVPTGSASRDLLILRLLAPPTRMCLASSDRGFR